MLIQELKNSQVVANFLCDVCSERGFSADINNVISQDDHVIIKVDDYYNSLGTKVPASPDCLIVIKCADGNFTIFIVELKDIANQHGFSNKNIREKFETCLNDFMQNVLRSHFVESQYIFNKIELYFVTDPYNQQNNPNRAKLNKTSKIDALLAMNTKPFNFDGKRLGIRHKIESPMINPC
ncbi:MAG: hypothetical protein ACYDCN_01485 [Bacteroidia bacterium]